MSFAKETQEQFNKVADVHFASLAQDEKAQLNLHAEESLFVRFNNNQVRQNTHVHQKELTLVLQKSNREVRLGFPLTGQFEWDSQAVLEHLQQARQEASQLPEDPYLVSIQNNGTSDHHLPGELLPMTEVVKEITTVADGTDFAGLYCAGPLVTANRNSLGQNHWFSTENFFVDFSLYNKEKSAKALYAGQAWKTQDFAHYHRLARINLELLNRPAVDVKPGAYRTYLAPGAVSELASMFSWGACSYSAYKQGRSALQKLADKEKSLSPHFSLQENFRLGLSPRFNSIGELAPEVLPLVTQGSLQNWLTSSRSAKEYQTVGNSAELSETLRSLEILPGSLKESDILKELGTGLYLSNLHYLNWSDRPNARITGMTRYACFWVDEGEIVGPIKDLRFDESLYEALGENLLAVTDFQAIEASVGTYSQRSWGGMKVPGMLIRDFKFTL